MTGNAASEREATGGFRDEILKWLPIGIVVVAIEEVDEPRSARIVEINPAAAALAGASSDRLRGKRVGDVPAFSTGEFVKQSLPVLESQAPMELGEVQLGLPGAQPSSCWVRAFPLPARRIGLTFEALRWHQQTETALRQSEESFRLLVRGVRDYAIMMLDPAGRILSWNEGAERLQGYGAEEIIGKNYSIFFTPGDRESGTPEAELAKARQEGQTEEEGWRVRKDGSRFWVNAVLTALHNEHGGLDGFVKITRDITDRREREAAVLAARDDLEVRVRERAGELERVNQQLQAEVRERQRAEEQLHALAARLQRAQEAERVRLAREIHDALGQLCTALKMDLTLLAQKLPKPERQLRSKAESALELVGELIRALRRLSTELRPGTLDALGLTAAMEWQAQEFQAHSGVPCQLQLPEQELDLEAERATALFRLFQEALTNVARHAHATLVRADLAVRDDSLVLVVRDNGRGFNAAQTQQRGSLGLLGMKERVLLLGGTFEVDSAPGKGTTLTVQIPLHPLARVS